MFSRLEKSFRFCFISYAWGIEYATV